MKAPSSRSIVKWATSSVALLCASLSQLGCTGQALHAALAPTVSKPAASVQARSPATAQATSVTRALFQIEVREGSRTVSSGTAFLVTSEGHLLTAGHVVRPATLGTGLQIWARSSGSDSVALPVKLLKIPSSPDVALLQLSEAAFNGVKPLALSLRVGFAQGQRLGTYGFKPNERNDTYQQGIVGQVQGETIRYSALTTSGFSGAPVFMEDSDVVVGLHIRGQEPGFAAVLSVEFLKDFLETEGIVNQVRRVPVANTANSGLLRSCPIGLQQGERLANFVGRTKELTEVTAALRQGLTVGVTGIGGIGKTSLVEEALWQLWETGDTQGGVLWVQVDSRPPYEVAQQIARELCRDDLQGERDPQTLLRALTRDLKERGTLVVLDNVLTDSTEAELLVGLKGTRLIETRRATLRHESLNVKLALSGLDRVDCLQHFVKQANMTTEQARSTTPEVKEVCERLNDHPLGVKLAASLYQEHGGTLDSFLRWLRLSGIQSLRTGEHSSQDLTKSFDLSLDLLSLEQQRLYRTLGVFPPSSEYTVEAVAAVSRRPPGLDLEQDLQRLQRLGLVTWNRNAQRYQQHNLLQKHALQRLEESKDFTATADRYLAYYQKLAAQLDQWPQQEWNERLKHDDQLIHVAAERIAQAFEESRSTTAARAAVDWAVLLSNYATTRHIPKAERWLRRGFESAKKLNDWHSQGQLALALGNYFYNGDRSKEAIHWYQAGLKLARGTGNRISEGNFLKGLGSAHLSLAEYAEATRSEQQWLQLALDRKDWQEVADSLSHMGFLFARISDQQTVNRHFEVALKLSRALGDRQMECRVLVDLGNALVSLGDEQNGVSHLELALKIAREIGARQTEAHALLNLGYALGNVQESSRATAFLEQALKIGREVGNRHTEAISLLNLGYALMAQSEDRQAAEFLERALTVAKEIGSRRIEVSALIDLAFTSANLGERATASTRLAQALEIATSIDDRRAQSEFLTQLGLAHLKIGRYNDAIDHIGHALEVAKASLDSRSQYAALLGLGLVYLSKVESQKATTFFEQALQVAANMDDKRQRFNALFHLGDSHQLRSDYTTATKYFEQALKTADSIGYRRGQAAVLRKLSAIQLEFWEPRLAIKYLRRAQSIVESIGNRREMGYVLLELGAAYLRLGDLSKAIEFDKRSLEILHSIRAGDGDADSLYELGMALGNLGDHRGARKYFEQALRIVRSTGERQKQGQTLCSLGLAYFYLGEHRRGIEALEVALETFRASGDRYGQMNALENIALIRAGLDKSGWGLEYRLQVLEIARGLGDKHREAAVRRTIAWIRIAQGKLSDAQAQWKRAIELYEELGLKTRADFERMALDRQTSATIAKKASTAPSASETFATRKSNP